jgi:SsrA-binding protein
LAVKSQPSLRGPLCTTSVFSFLPDVKQLSLIGRQLSVNLSDICALLTKKIKMEIKNRSAYFEFFIDDKYVAGIVLTGTEVKSLRAGKANFNDSYCIFHNGELWIRSLHISEYSHGTINNHDPIRERKLLLNRRELKKLEARIKEKGYTIVPLRLFLNENNLVKLEIGLGKGKKVYDKRETIKQRDTEREIKRYIK